MPIGDSSPFSGIPLEDPGAVVGRDFLGNTENGSLDVENLLVGGLLPLRPRENVGHCLVGDFGSNRAQPLTLDRLHFIFNLPALGLGALPKSEFLTSVMEGRIDGSLSQHFCKTFQMASESP